MFDYDKFNNNASLDLVINGVRKKIPRFYPIYIYIYAVSLLEAMIEEERKRKGKGIGRN